LDEEDSSIKEGSKDSRRDSANTTTIKTLPIACQMEPQIKLAETLENSLKKESEEPLAIVSSSLAVRTQTTNSYRNSRKYSPEKMKLNSQEKL